MTFLFPDLTPQSPPRGRAPRRRKSLPGTCVGQEWPLEGKINVVLFAGMGGACQGMEEAGYPVHIAVNHDEIAIAAHKALNPHTKHLQADIYEIDPLEACGGRAVGLLWASPDCRDHSVAKGGAPRSPRVRSMPWQVCRWVGRMRKRGLGPDVVFLENVREIRGWAALVAKRDKATGRVVKLDGTIAAKGERVPVREQQLVRDHKRVGGTYRAWVKHMEGLGATWEDRDLCCADFGVPTSRKRLWGVAHFDGAQAYWGPATNGHRNSDPVRAGKLLPHAPAADFIDWSLPLPSIFDRKKDLAPATLKRVAVGMKRFVLEAEKPFLIHLTHQGTRPAMDVDDAGATLTGAHRGEVAVVAPLVISPNHTASYYDYFRGHGADEAAQTMTQNMGHALVGATLIPTTHSKSPPRAHDGAGAAPTFTAAVKGGEIAAMAATVIGAGGRAAQMGPIDVAGPLNTSTTKEDRCVVAAHLVQTGYGERAGQAPRCQDIENSIGTQVAGGGKHAVIAAHLTKFQENSIGHHPNDAIDTLMAGAARFGVVAAYLEEHRSHSVGQPVADPVATQTAKEHHAVCGAWMVQHNTGVVGHTPDDSLSTMTTLGTQQQVAGAFMVHQRGTGTATSAEDAVRTMATGGGKGGDHVGTCAAFLTEYYGTGGQHCGADDALNTLSTADRFAVTGGHVVHPPLSPAQLARAREVAEFLRSHGVWNGGDIVTFGPWIVVDIGMRMLRPAEAAAAHELRMPDLIKVRKRHTAGKLKGSVVLDPDGNEVWVERPLTKTEAMRLIGNSVPKRMARLLVEWNARRALGPAREVAA